MQTPEVGESGQHGHQQAKPLDEAKWEAWIRKGREQDRRTDLALAKAVEWLSLFALLAVAALWSRIPPYEIVVRFILAACSIAAMLYALNVRSYAFAGVFAVIAVLYNPLAAVFSFSGDLARAFVAASALPFAVSLAIRPSGRVQHA